METLEQWPLCWPLVDCLDIVQYPGNAGGIGWELTLWHMWYIINIIRSNLVFFFDSMRLYKYKRGQHTVYPNRKISCKSKVHLCLIYYIRALYLQLLVIQIVSNILKRKIWKEDFWDFQQKRTKDIHTLLYYAQHCGQVYILDGQCQQCY